MTIEVTIDRDECISCGTCEQTCGDVFELDEDDISQVVEEYRSGSKGEGEIPDDKEECAKNAAESCPQQIIEV